MATKKILLTKEGLHKLEQELEYLKNEKRVEISEKLKEAISFWDLSENSEYEEARNEQAQVEKRIMDLEEQLKNVEVIDEKNAKKDDKIKIGSIVTIENVETKEKDDYKIVGITETDILAKPKKISNESPVGKALIWKKKWATIKVTAPWGKFEYKILNVK